MTTMRISKPFQVRFREVIGTSLRRLQRFYFGTVFGMDIHPTAQMSMSAKLDTTHPEGVHVGAHVYITTGAKIFTHDMSRDLRADTWLHENVFIGANAIVLPGVSVGPNAVVAAGAVVTRDVAPGTVVAGNPAQVVRRGVAIGHYGIVQESDA